jgi:hypothetical protein
METLVNLFLIWGLSSLVLWEFFKTELGDEIKHTLQEESGVSDTEAHQIFCVLCLFGPFTIIALIVDMVLSLNNKGK